MISYLMTEKKIAKYILNNPKEVVDMTVSELAETSDVSIASVSRFCRKVGLKRFCPVKDFFSTGISGYT